MTKGPQRNRWRTLASVLAAGVLCLSCSSTPNPYYDAAKSHHTPDGFRNNYLKEEMVSHFARWQWERTIAGLPKPPANGYHFPVDRPDVAWLKANRSATTATWIGHSTMLMQVNGVNVLTDPVFSDRVSPLSFAGPKRKVELPMKLEELPHIEVVMISHNHYDHLDLDTVQDLNEQPGGPPLFVVPLGLKPWMAEAGITNVVELDWWQKTGVDGLDLTLVPLQHWSARSFDDRFDTLWGGWVAQTPAGGRQPFSFFFACDTGYSKDFDDIGKKFGGFDLALIPIGAYAPHWFMHPQHVDPGEAVKIHRDVHARASIGIHWGTFELTDEPLDEPPAVLAREVKAAGLAADAFTTMRHGETRRF
jgi:L-ascorbate metabolism protein UlaG (beta-lactamase superfamily)